MTKIVLADCCRHHIAVPTPPQPDDYICPHCHVERLEAQIAAIEKAGWRSCIDHIIRPDSPCPVCRIEELEASRCPHDQSYMELLAMVDELEAQITLEQSNTPEHARD